MAVVRFLFLVLVSVLSVSANIIYVDAQISSGSCTAYSTLTRSCTGGSSTAFRDLTAASDAARPGDTVYIRQGTFTSQFSPQQSGSSGAYIVFRNYADETVTLSNINSPALNIVKHDYIVIEGFTINDVTGWAWLDSSHHNIFRDNRFSQANARGTTGGFKVRSSTHNRFLGNTSIIPARRP